MRLICFAHRGEAQSFLTGAEKVFEKGLLSGSLFRKDAEYILLTGEGVESSILMVSAALQALNCNSMELWNYGISGALRDFINIGEIYQIRSVYGVRSDDSNCFESYSLDGNGAADCVSSSSRVLNQQSSEKLSHFADVVDRELWGIAKVCRAFSLKLRAFKLVSDRPRKGVDCFDVKARAMEWSEQIKAFHGRLANAEQSSMKVHEAEAEDLKSEALKRFKFTQSQKHQFKRLASVFVKRMGEGELNVFLDQFSQREKGQNEKQRASEFLSKLEMKLFPEYKSLKNAYEKLFSSSNHPSFQVKHDPRLEQEEIELKVTVRDPRELKKVSQSLLEISENWTLTKVKNEI